MFWRFQSGGFENEIGHHLDGECVGDAGLIGGRGLIDEFEPGREKLRSIDEHDRTG
jgi:hypothetical protein